MTDTSKMRGEFEAWASARYSWHLFEDARGECDKTLTSWDGQAYGNRIVEGMWQGGQASRQAVVVELPESFEKRDVQGLDYDETVAAIEAQGLRCEVKA